ncbi:MAG TPA: methyltransferase domain-containing protein [Bryobacteraceae bacterium]|nr:methyltransferase domain-containing protein [Bryobacteraceae bacterium]
MDCEPASALSVTPPKKLTVEQQLEKMRRDWDERARENARYYVNTARQDWTDEDFFASGEQLIAEDILTDMGNICQGKDPRQMRVLEIGCGAGRLTRALAKVFGEVHAVDISGEMVAAARRAVADFPHAHVYQNNGCDLTVIPSKPFDFAYSAIVFQHIPSREIIENYVRDVHRLLRRGALFKFWVQGDTRTESSPDDTWLGVPFSDADSIDMAERCGFEPRHRHGAGGQYFILWFFKYGWLGAQQARVRVWARAVRKKLGRAKRSLLARMKR